MYNVKYAPTIFALFTLLPVSNAQVALPATESPPATVNPIPVAVQLKKTVVSVTTDCQAKDMKGKSLLESFSGTGFFLTYEDPNYPGIGFFYLVTNRHVATPGVENNQPCTVHGSMIRLNRKEPKPDGTYAESLSLAQIASLKFLGNRVSWSFPEDDSVDLAVIPVALDRRLYDFLTIPSSLLLTNKQLSEKRVVEGDPVLFSGLFVQFAGQTRLEPIVRTGKIAMIPGELIPTTLHKLGTAYLVDTHVFGGNSGSPLFIDFGGMRNGNISASTDASLLGIISGFVKETSNFDLRPVASYAGTVEENSGISMVVPAQQLLDLLESEKLATLRKLSLPARNKSK